jgi:hypothetical protein
MYLKAPRGHTELAHVSVGRPYGHVPGHHFHDVEVLVTHNPRCWRKTQFRVAVLEIAGSDQGDRDRIHHRKEMVFRADSLHQAIETARWKARDASFSMEYLNKALDQAMVEAATEEIVS